jgi:hypothetical protein
MRAMIFGIAPVIVFLGRRIWGAVNTLRLREEILRDEFNEEAPAIGKYRLSRVSVRQVAFEAMVASESRLIHPLK